MSMDVRVSSVMRDQCCWTNGRNCCGHLISTHSVWIVWLFYCGMNANIRRKTRKNVRKILTHRSSSRVGGSLSCFSLLTPHNGIRRKVCGSCCCLMLNSCISHPHQSHFPREKCCLCRLLYQKEFRPSKGPIVSAGLWSGWDVWLNWGQSGRAAAFQTFHPLEQSRTGYFSLPFSLSLLPREHPKKEE